MSQQPAKEVLLRSLGELLGFDDGSEDVLEHLLTIDSSEDLLDYLSQLLGTNDDKVKFFASNLSAFQKGEPLTLLPPAERTSRPNNKDQHTLSHSPLKLDGKTTPPNATTKNAAVAHTTKASSSKANTKTSTLLPPTDSNVAKKSNSHSDVPRDESESTTQQADPPLIKEKVIQKSIPQRGKASFVCGCFGTLHKTLANCLVCGRISCQREGFDFCPFCGFLVERPPEGVSRTDQAWLHKERLLRFDRESTQRMIVIDDQSDYAATHQMAWLTQEETDEAEEKQAEREQNFRQRPTMQLDLAL